MLYYRDFLWKLAYSNNFILNYNWNGNNNEIKNKLKFYIGRGNNSKLLKKIMGRRWWWI